jgi:YHS domain-containing protein
VHGSEHKEPAAQTTCPVMGGEINKEIYADHDGKRVYFCCPACIEKFKNDPDKYPGKLKESGQKPLTLTSLSPQSTCPVMGGGINRELYADYQGKRVYFCCAGCKAPFEKEPDKYLEKLRKSGQKPEVIAN